MSSSNEEGGLGGFISETVRRISKAFDQEEGEQSAGKSEDADTVAPLPEPKPADEKAGVAGFFVKKRAASVSAADQPADGKSLPAEPSARRATLAGAPQRPTPATEMPPASHGGREEASGLPASAEQVPAPVATVSASATAPVPIAPSLPSRPSPSSVASKAPVATIRELGHVFDELSSFASLQPKVFGDAVEPPAFVVVGKEGAAKSSLLERLTHLPVFPRADSLCTRAVVRVCLRRVASSAPSATLESIDAKDFFDAPAGGGGGPVEDLGQLLDPAGRLVSGGEAAHVAGTVKRLMERLVGPHATGSARREICSDRFIVLTVRHPTVPTLDLFDLPGLVGAEKASKAIRDVYTRLIDRCGRGWRRGARGGDMCRMEMEWDERRRRRHGRRATSAATLANSPCSPALLASRAYPCRLARITRFTRAVATGHMRTAFESDRTRTSWPSSPTASRPPATWESQCCTRATSLRNESSVSERSGRCRSVPAAVPCGLDSPHPIPSWQASSQRPTGRLARTQRGCPPTLSARLATRSETRRACSRALDGW